MRIVLDTNVLLAGFATHGLCEALVILCFRDHEVILSDHILNELARHYRVKFKASPEQVDLVLAMLRVHGKIVIPARVPTKTFEDRDDLPVLGTAVAGHAACIVTGDKRLADLETYQTIPIITPRACYERIRA